MEVRADVAASRPVTASDSWDDDRERALREKAVDAAARARRDAIQRLNAISATEDGAAALDWAAVGAAALTSDAPPVLERVALVDLQNGDARGTLPPLLPSPSPPLRQTPCRRCSGGRIEAVSRPYLGRVTSYLPTNELYRVTPELALHPAGPAQRRYVSKQP